MATAKAVFSRHGGYNVIHKDYRSGLEDKIAKQLSNAGVDFQYEKHFIPYEIPASNHKYTPDFILPNGIIVEAKGVFDTDDRQKHLLVKKQYPELEIRFVFTNPYTKLYKGAKTTYADWCKKYGYQFAKGYVPSEWIKDTNQYSLEGVVARAKA